MDTAVNISTKIALNEKSFQEQFYEAMFSEDWEEIVSMDLSTAWTVLFLSTSRILSTVMGYLFRLLYASRIKQNRKRSSTRRGTMQNISMIFRGVPLVRHLPEYRAFPPKLRSEKSPLITLPRIKKRKNKKNKFKEIEEKEEKTGKIRIEERKEGEKEKKKWIWLYVLMGVVALAAICTIS